MARRVVVAARRQTWLRGAMLGCSLSGVVACTSFHPVEETRFTLLDNAVAFRSLGIPSAHWEAYDDQHSRWSACTNGAAGDHEPRECSHLDRPFFDWDGGKCPPTPDQLEQGYFPIPTSKLPAPTSNRICIQGELNTLAACKNAQCKEVNGLDNSNMWGAGVGLAFSSDRKLAWNPHEYGVRGVAFDLIVFPEDAPLAGGGLNLRVQVPSVLSPADTSVAYEQSLIRDDGNVVDPQGNVYDCNSGKVTDYLKPPVSLRDVDSGTITSEQHPYGSSFWQLPMKDTWGPSPVVLGHNEFSWDEIQPPPESNANYQFDDEKILGVYFQVAHPTTPNRAPIPFAFCIDNLAFLLE